MEAISFLPLTSLLFRTASRSIYTNSSANAIFQYATTHNTTTVKHNRSWKGSHQEFSKVELQRTSFSFTPRENDFLLPLERCFWGLAVSLLLAWTGGSESAMLVPPLPDFRLFFAFETIVSFQSLFTMDIKSFSLSLRSQT